MNVVFNDIENATTKVLNISAVNINKTVLLTDVHGRDSASFYAIARLASDTTINVSANGYHYNSNYTSPSYDVAILGTVNIQVVEFY